MQTGHREVVIGESGLFQYGRRLSLGRYWDGGRY